LQFVVLENGAVIANSAHFKPMRRTILSVAYPLTEVGADAVGGSEQILAILDRRLTDAGHHSVVIAAEGSKIKGTLLPSPGPSKRLDHSIRNWGRGVHQRLINEALARYPIDLVHMHGLDFYRYLPSTKLPILATLHLPPAWYPPEVFQIRQTFFYMNCVSRAQHQSCPRCAHLLPPIPNGVEVDRLAGAIPKQNFAMAMGRICPEKGYHFALDAARRAGIELLLAGEVFPMESHVQYFKSEILPRLDKQRRFLGPLRFSRKRRLLSQAKCLLIPSTVAETSSLVAMEALACGTPVIAFRSGALPEIIDHGHTGFIVSDADEMGRALADIDTLQPEKCRQAARSRFSAPTMVAAYIELYERLIDERIQKLGQAPLRRTDRMVANL
jgi:glycosyltransferase involved in cell wall biosynthesis